jgi:predicted dehydrogenase
MTLRRRAKRVGILGAGEIVRSHHLPVLLAAGVKVAWVADPSTYALSQTRARFQTPTLSIEAAWADLDNVDAVLLAAPVGFRLEHHERLAQSRTSVYLEKPIARTVQELDELILLYGDSRVTCGFQRRAFANVVQLRALLRTLPVGPVKRIELSEGSRTLATGTSSDFRDDVGAAGGGILTDLGCHGLDVIDQLIGLHDAAVVDQTMIVDEGLERDVSVQIRAGAIDVAMELSWLRDCSSGLRIVCENGTISSPAKLLGGIRIEPLNGPHCEVSSVGTQNLSQAFWDVWSHALWPQHDHSVDYSLPTTRSVLSITDSIYRLAGLR